MFRTVCAFREIERGGAFRGWTPRTAEQVTSGKRNDVFVGGKLASALATIAPEDLSLFFASVELVERYDWKDRDMGDHWYSQWTIAPDSSVEPATNEDYEAAKASPNGNGNGTVVTEVRQPAGQELSWLSQVKTRLVEVDEERQIQRYLLLDEDLDALSDEFRAACVEILGELRRRRGNALEDSIRELLRTKEDELVAQAMAAVSLDEVLLERMEQLNEANGSDKGPVSGDEEWQNAAAQADVAAKEGE